MASEVLLLGGRSGVGKSSVASECHAALGAAGVRHCLIDGDMLDMAYPTPWEHGLAERNLTAMWTNYRTLGYRRLIFINSACVLPTEAGKLAAAMGDDPRIVPVMLTCTDATAAQRLGRREIGQQLNQHLDASTRMATALTNGVDATTYRIPTDDRTVADVTAAVIACTGWVHG
jgi:hypothetical protein